MRTINVFAGNSDNGNRVYEQLLVTDLENSIFRIEASPGLVLGIAKGDEIEFRSETGDYKILRRGGNLSIQIFISPEMKTSLSKLQSELEISLGASLDGLTEKQAVFSIAASRGFQSIEKFLNKFVAENPKSEWFYGNVYDSDGVTPLNWWAK